MKASSSTSVELPACCGTRMLPHHTPSKWGALWGTKFLILEWEVVSSWDHSLFHRAWSLTLHRECVEWKQPSPQSREQREGTNAGANRQYPPKSCCQGKHCISMEINKIWEHIFSLHLYSYFMTSEIFTESEIHLLLQLLDSKATSLWKMLSLASGSEANYLSIYLKGSMSCEDWHLNY